MGNKKKNQPEGWTKAFLKHSSNRVVHKIRNHFYQKAFFDFVKNKEMKILDVGCGDGDFLKLLEKKGYKNLYGIDPNKILLKKIKGNINFKKGFATDLPFKKDFFDVIYIYNVLHHLKSIEDYYQALSEIKRCLKKGGLFIIVEPSSKLIFSTLYISSRLLHPYFKVFSSYYTVLSEEWKDLTLFLSNSKLIRKRLTRSLGFKVLRDKRIFHQWTLVVKK